MRNKQQNKMTMNDNQDKSHDTRATAAADHAMSRRGGVKPMFTAKLAGWYFSRKSLPYWCVFTLDCATVMLSYLFVYQQMNSGVETLNVFWHLCSMLGVFVLLHALGFKIFHTYDGILRYSSFVDLQRVGYAVVFGATLTYAIHFPLMQYDYFRMVYISGYDIMLASLIAMLLMWALRVLVKTVYDVSIDNINAKSTYIYGLMEESMGLAKQLRNDKRLNMRLDGFVADTPTVTHRRLMGVRVWPFDDRLMHVLESRGVECLLVSRGIMHTFRKNKDFQDRLISAGIKIVVQNTAEEWDPTHATPHLREVSICDLLPRDEIRVDLDGIAATLRGKSVLVTGSAGSIGSEIVRQVCAFAPSSMILIDSAETPQHDMRLMMARHFPHIKAETIVTSICSRTRMEHIFAKYRPDYVFHAAAYKHVPMMEDNPCESVYNNVCGTRNVADMAVKYGTRKFVMISTDKAVNPTNVMGCSKRICEIYVQSLNNAIRDGKVRGVTQFVTTRFGNVLGSNGSVIPLFKRQIRAGGPVTVTHPEIIRYFMLIPEACKLVLEAGAKGNGGEIFVFDMGEPVKIADLARRMIRLSGAEGVEIKFTGLRPGEKLYEEVLGAQEHTKPSFHDKIRIASVREYDYAVVQAMTDELVDIGSRYDDMAVVKKMKEIVPEFKSNNSVYEVLDRK